MKLETTLLVLAGLAASSSLAADAAPSKGAACSKAAIAAAGAAVRAARAELVAIPLEDGDTSVSPEAGRRIEAVKDRLRDFVGAEMACAPASPETRAIAMEMGVKGDAAPYRPNSGRPERHGDVLTYEVSPVATHPEMLAVIATLGIQCGSDSILMLYGRTPAGWRELMVRRAEPYREVKGGWGDFRFAVSPADAKGNWFVATVSTTPWCTSAWQGMPYALARPGSAPERPRIIFRGKDTIYLGGESDLMLKAEPGAFELRHDGASLDSDILIRRHVRRYSVTGNSIRRVPPVAENVRDFVDEWIDSPWLEAKGWSGPDPVLAAAHSRLQAARFKTLGGFASIRACAGGATQIEIAGEDGPGWFLTVRGSAAGPWTLARVARRPDSGCTGPDRLGRDPR